MRGFSAVKISLTLAFILVFNARSVFAQMTSSNYQILWDELSAGGGESTSGSYIQRGSVGNGSGGNSTSANYSLSPGFRGGVFDPAVAFIPYIEDRTTQVAATNFTGDVLPPAASVEVTTTSGFAVGDVVLVVGNEGASQTTFMGRLSAILSIPPTLVFATDYVGDFPTVDGTNDFVYRMSPTATINFGTLSTSSVATHTIGWMATADVTQGYATYLFSDGSLHSGSNVIADVVDGTVSAGSNEYGGRSSDSTLSTSTFDTADTAISTEPALIGSVSTNVFSSLGFVTLKIAVDGTQPTGSYSQTLTTIFVGDY